MPAQPYATEIVKTLVDAGHTAYFAGGWVRDYLMKKPSDDIDIATSASVKEVQKIFPKTIPVGISFGIVIVVIDRFQFEVATFRKDRGYLDGRRPTSIEAATPEEDAQRRDFTINGMFYDPLKKELWDFVEGQKDIEKKLVKAIGNPIERFQEDRLRMMRAVRYATRFNFAIEPETFHAILNQAHTLLPSVAMERIWQEFKKMSQFAHFDQGLITLHRLRLLPTIFPVLKELSTDEIARRVAPIERFPKEAPTIAELIELFPDSSLEDLLALCDYLKLPNQEKIFARFSHHAKKMLEMPEEWQKRLEPAEWAHFYANKYAKICLEIYAAHLTKADAEIFLSHHFSQIKFFKNSIDRIQNNDPVITGERLIQLGVPQGKKLGLLLKEAERISINENSEDPEFILKKLNLGEKN